ncbi:recombinase [Sinomonas cellulolyticus]|nr:recombinase [Sinomonas sp. KCTC 49339]
MSLDLDLLSPPETVPEQKRAVLYLRVSSAGQVNTDYDPEGISIPAQRVACQRKAEQLGLTIVGEYVEAGKSATTMVGRVEFQQMLQRIRNDKDIEYVIVYKLSRMARNRYDDAIVMADLRKRGVTLISATESIDDTPVGQLMHGILAAFNEYRSREDGADIAYKMGQKARKGGTVNMAPLGYLNTIDRVDGREVRAVTIDEERADLVRLAFELYASGEYTIEELADEMEARGLRSRRTPRRASQPISVTKFHRMLKDPYYLGYVTFHGEHYEGRHPALIDRETFDAVQRVIASRSGNGVRKRKHHHYLKGSIFCGQCARRGETNRMVLQLCTAKSGQTYGYFFCTGTKRHVCRMRHLPTHRVEDAVERHYSAVGLSEAFVTQVKAQIRSVVDDANGATRLLNDQLSEQLETLARQESNLIDLAADGVLGKDQIRAKLMDIADQRAKVRSRLETTTDDLSAGAELVEACLDLLRDPYWLYRRCSDDQRRELNLALFTHIYLDEDNVSGHLLEEPFQLLLDLHRHQELIASGLRDPDKPVPKATTTTDTKRAAPQDGSLRYSGLSDVEDCFDFSNKPYWVEVRGFEPLTFCMPCRRATNCAIPPWS